MAGVLRVKKAINNLVAIEQEGIFLFLSALSVAGFILLRPFSFMNYMGIQFAHLILIFGLVICLGNLSKDDLYNKSKIYKLMTPAGVFFILSIITGSYYSVVSTDVLAIKNALVHNVNLLIFFFICFSVSRFGEKFERFVDWCVIITVILQIAVTILMPVLGEVSDSRRQNYFFSPNQFGYYLFICLSYLYFFRERVRDILNKRNYQLLITSCILLIVLSVSRAAILSSVFLLLIMMRENKWKLLIMIATIITFFLFLKEIFLFEPLMKFLNIENDKVRSMILYSERYSKLYQWSIYHRLIELRAIDRIFLYPEFLLFGAGEWGYERFYQTRECIQGECFEIHNSYLQILFSYGSIGFLCLVSFLKRAFSNNYWNAILIFSPLIIYNSLHVGLRESLLWIFLAMVFMNLKRQKDARLI